MWSPGSHLQFSRMVSVLSMGKNADMADLPIFAYLQQSLNAEARESKENFFFLSEEAII